MKNYYGKKGPKGKRIVGKTANDKYHLTNYGSGSIPTDPKAAKKLGEAYDYSYQAPKEKIRG
jgi:hypothetical protein|tara:strand:+ start:2143 stop:2328 length:186 start_codon:yes stop_codon:yes gene_type:complete